MTSLKVEKLARKPDSSLTYEGILTVESFSVMGWAAVGTFHTSPSFQIGEIEWHLRFYPGGYDEVHSNWLAVEFVAENSEAFPADSDGQLRVSILDSKSDKELTTFTSSITDKIFKRVISRDYIRQNYGLFASGSLKIKFGICLPLTEQGSATLEETASSSIEEPSIPVGSTAQDSVCARMIKLLSLDHQDVILLVNEHEFRGHRSVIATASPILESLVYPQRRDGGRSRGIDNTAQSIDGLLTVRVEDVEPVAVKSMLKFLYTGTIEEDAAAETLALAEKFEVTDLKQLCEEVLSDKLSLESIYDLFQLAYATNAETLKNNAKAFVEMNYTEIRRNPDFRRLLERLEPNARTSFFCAAPIPPSPPSSS